MLSRAKLQDLTSYCTAAAEAKKMVLIYHLVQPVNEVQIINGEKIDQYNVL